MPVDLTAEAASDTNSLGDSDRGVFLTWNMQLQGDASETTSYHIERIRMNTGVPALNDEADDWQHVTRVTGVTSYTDDIALRQVDEDTPSTETRMYQVCSEASGIVEPACVAMAVDYELHQAEHDAVPPDLTDVEDVTETANADGSITVSWMGGDNSDSFLLIALDLTSDPRGDYEVESISDGMAQMGTIDGLTSGTQYLVIVLAIQGTGDSRVIHYDTLTVTAN